MGKLVAAMAALVIAILLVYNGLWPNYRTKVNGPESTIGKSGEMKSPGGSAETRERRLSWRLFHSGYRPTARVFHPYARGGTSVS
jgi:hypothetical protein